jgi:hypothetical protein
MTNPVPYRAGDLFAVPLPDGTFATARILLDVSVQCMDPKLAPRSSPLKTFEGSLLVEVYRDVTSEPSGRASDVAIPGVFIIPRQLAVRGKDKWSLTGHIDVDPERVAFPEALHYSSGRVAFSSGEIKRILDVDPSILDRYKTRPSVVNPPALIDACCYYLRRKEIAGSSDELMSLQWSDLRFTDDRDEIYRLMHEDPSRSYYETAKALGFDLARFYG